MSKKDCLMPMVEKPTNLPPPPPMQKHATCNGCKNYRIAALSCFGPDVYICAITEKKAEAGGTCSEWKARAA